MNTIRPHRLALTRLALALVPALSTFQVAPTQAAVVRWVGAHGDVWSLGSNWSGNALPGPLDAVDLGAFNTLINSPVAVSSVSGTGTLRIFGFGNNGLSLSGDSTLGGLTQDGGTFRSSATTVISGELQWRQGNFSGTGLSLIHI